MTSQRNNYNINYSRVVKPRYFKDYQRTNNMYVITASKDVYNLHLKFIRKNYLDVMISRDGEYYIIRAYNLT